MAAGERTEDASSVEWQLVGGRERFSIQCALESKGAGDVARRGRGAVSATTATASASSGCIDNCLDWIAVLRRLSIG
jgi:uncharacterized heparinase superfamily protein